MIESMDIYSPQGTKVVFTNSQGHDFEPVQAVQAGLIPMETYTVMRVEVGGWSSKVILEEFPDHRFNTVMFAPKYKMKAYVWSPELSLEEQKDGAYWERNMLALYTAMYANKAWREFNGYLKVAGSPTAKDPDNLPCGWYYDTDNNWDGWKRVISLFDGRITYHVPDDFDMGRLPEIKPNWDGHSTQDKYNMMMERCGIVHE
jgi:hypothetical protein